MNLKAIYMHIKTLELGSIGYTSSPPNAWHNAPYAMQTLEI